jgi:hypothetical protein
MSGAENSISHVAFVFDCRTAADASDNVWQKAVTEERRERSPLCSFCSHSLSPSLTP